MAETGTAARTRSELRRAIERGGYYPALVADAMESAVGAEAVRSWMVHQETMLDHSEVRRHVTVLALTQTRLLVGHTDEHPPDGTSPQAYATTATEAVPLSRVDSVVVTRVVPDPAHYRPGTAASEVVLAVGWGIVGRVDLEPASCDDPTCEADHGYTGSLSADDLSLRVSAAAEGQEAVTQTLTFAADLSEAVSGRSR